MTGPRPPRLPPKSARGSRSVPISTPLAGALETWRKTTFYSDDDLVFAHPLHGRPLPEAMITRRFQAHAKLARVRADVRFHDLRHTFGTTMAASGVPMRTLQEWMGHRDLQTTLIYADYVESPHRRRWSIRRFTICKIEAKLSPRSIRCSDHLRANPHGS